MSLYSLATLAAFRTYLGVEDGSDAPLLHALRAATLYLEHSTHRRLAPLLAARRCDLMLHDLRECILGEELLELHECRDGNGDIVPLGELIVLYGAILHRLHRPFTFTYGPVAAIEVTGIWGSHSDWPSAWRSSGDVLVSSIGSAATTLTVGAVNAMDAALHAPRFSAGQLVRVGAEWCIVLKTDAAAQTLHVVRGANGSTATAHAAGVPLDVFIPDGDSVQACLRLAASFYREPLEDHSQAARLLVQRPRT